jgi:hypothetical protein
VGVTIVYIIQKVRGSWFVQLPTWWVLQLRGRGGSNLQSFLIQLAERSVTRTTTDRKTFSWDYNVNSVLRLRIAI